MALTESGVKLLIQQAVIDGTVTIVGSGLSAAAGLPSMSQLADLLISEMPVEAEMSTRWEPVADALKRTDLESAMEGLAADDPLLVDVVSLIGAAVSASEQQVLAEMVDGRELPLGRLLGLLQRVNPRVLVITTNYDRLVEAAAEQTGLAIDTTFMGAYFGRFDPETSRQLFQSLPRQRNRRLTTTTRPHVTVLKPHGSLDWYQVDGEPVRSLIDLDRPRLIVTPGTSKYEIGYERPFDYHREAGNRVIDEARALLIVGYGFNDSHLQTHLGPALARGTPAVVMTRTLTPAAHEQIATATNLLALERTPGTPAGESSTTAHYGGAQAVFAGCDLWDLESLIKEALA